MAQARVSGREVEQPTGSGDEVVNLGARLREVRVRSGLSLRAVARELGVSPSFVSQLENDRSRPSVATLYSLGPTAQRLDGRVVRTGRPRRGCAARGDQDQIGGAAARVTKPAGTNGRRPPASGNGSGNGDCGVNGGREPVSRSDLGSPAEAVERRARHASALGDQTGQSLAAGDGQRCRLGAVGRQRRARSRLHRDRVSPREQLDEQRPHAAARRRTSAGTCWKVSSKSPSASSRPSSMPARPSASTVRFPTCSATSATCPRVGIWCVFDQHPLKPVSVLLDACNRSVVPSLNTRGTSRRLPLHPGLVVVTLL